MQLTIEGSHEAVAPNVCSHETIHQFRVRPIDVGDTGFVDAGTLLEWIDTAAHATAAQWCAGHCVAASVGNVHLDRPIGVGELVDVRATLVYTGRSSMHILITVRSSDPAQAKSPQSAQCAIIFVAFDVNGEPMEVPRWTPLTMLELQRHRQARARVRMRKRIDEAMEAETYTAEGTAPCATLRFRAASTDGDGASKVRGGRVMRWIDEVAYACGADWTGADVVTSYVTGIWLCQPIFVGDVVDVTARIIHTGPRSVHMSVRVVTAGVLVAQGVVVVVSLSADGEAQPVPQWRPDSDEDRRLNLHARHLIELRQYLEPFTTACVA
jgi:4-hydroxybenzoyl-CoA thioesterase